jgi:hypothetical protein
MNSSRCARYQRVACSVRIAAWTPTSHVSFGCSKSPTAMTSGPTAKLVAPIMVW